MQNQLIQLRAANAINALDALNFPTVAEALRGQFAMWIGPGTIDDATMASEIVTAELAIQGARQPHCPDRLKGTLAVLGGSLMTCRDTDPTRDMIARASRYYAPDMSANDQLARNVDNLIVDLALDYQNYPSAEGLDEIKEHLKFAQRQLEEVINAIRGLEKGAR